MSVSAPSGKELETLIDAYLDANQIDFPASEGVRRAARAVVLEMSETERRALRFEAGQEKSIVFSRMALWVVQVAALAGAYLAVFYAVLVMQISLLPVVLFVVLTGILWIGFGSVRDFRRNNSMAADLK
ncbi:hypothetical protein FGK63_19715 [Ruegeria sediminis]|uniref:DUF2335 domain-containing protein n=1 Tax=Ruegeria sediminis TaxID=2583820 RepID=A0ABY2WSL9_9RHOB|nr:hypothetical protein [Ruegeria sediminis]TMV03402.1 hypothetical protein FGK63_19715 [Ruegeria sediminis]